MPCVIQIKDDITSTIEEMSGNYTNKTPSFIKILQNTINNRFKVPVVTFLKQTDDTFLSKIHIPQSLIDEYYKNELLIEGERDAYEKEKKSLKKGVLELFDSNSELSKIGTPEQYSQYLNTIFPNSKVKDIVYHGTNRKFEQFNKDFLASRDAYKNASSLGFYFTTSKSLAEKYLPKIDIDPFGLGEKIIDVENATIIKAMLNIKNPIKISEEVFGNIQSDIKKQDFQKDIDSLSVDNYTFSVFEPEQIHILGSKQDVEGFKEFINNKNYNNKNTSDSIFNEYGVTHEEWNNASESEREMIIWQSKNNC